MEQGSDSNNHSEPDQKFGSYLKDIIVNLQSIQRNIFTEEAVKDVSVESEKLKIETQVDPDVALEAMENQFSTWMASFYNIFVYLIINLISFLISMINPSFNYLPLTLLIIFPFYLWFIFLYSIPEVVINDRVIFSRNMLDLRKQIRLGRFMFTFFLRQLYENSKTGIIIIGIFIIFLGIVSANVYLI